MTLSCKWPFNTKNERNNASSLPNWISHFFLPLVFPHVSAFKSNLPVHTYPTYIRIISITQDSTGNIGNWACIQVAILNAIFTVQMTLAYPDLASTRFWVHSVLKNFHSEERIEKVADSYAGLIHRIRVDDSKPNPERKNSGLKNIRIRMDGQQ